MTEQITVDIWSDIVCPFCYIGKRKFEAALGKFAGKDNVVVRWHSFLLNRQLQVTPGVDIYDHLAHMKGQTREWSVQAHNYVTQMAAAVGLSYRFDKAQVANSFDAHRVIQLAKKHGLDDAIEERFFKAYFTEGELISDHETLTRLASQVGLNKEEVIDTLSNDLYVHEVNEDEQMARSLGVTGVPFFLFNGMQAITGAVDEAVFLDMLMKISK